MIDLDRELRATLAERVRLAPAPFDARRGIRVARRRQVGVIVTALAVTAAVVAGSFAGVSALIRSSERQIPAEPPDAPSPGVLEAVPTRMRLEPVQGLEPVRLSTSIGEIEFTTWGVPDLPDGGWLWPMTETTHGIVAAWGDGLAGSLDGVTWTRVVRSTAPTRGGEFFVVPYPVGSAGRLERDGSAWVYTPDPREFDRGAIGPQGIVAVASKWVFYWDGTGFTFATQPPDPSLHPGSSPGCAAQDLSDTRTEVLVAATDDGFIALAARGEDDWPKNPVCEPLVWFSTDGNEWVPTSDESPFGAGAFVRDIAAAGGRIVAVGGVSFDEAAVWVSEDGVDWERTPLDAAEVAQVAGGERGWIAIGGREGPSGEMWFSPDGLVWDGPYERPPGWVSFRDIGGVAMLDDRIVGVGTFYAGGGGVVVGEFIDE